MLALRTVLALAITICGAAIVVRVAALGLRVQTLPGLVLGAAMIALGIHRLSLILRLRRGTAR
ncbi:MAG: hypothetical protein JOY69_06800 [Candidatus Eremiobacteraeota bacterium]|nr:hypothetical protein [Candidatus Eremiobacteraeota bacterium]